MSFRIQPTSLTFSCDLLFSLHLDHFNSTSRYSLTSCFQYWFIICCIILHVLKLAGIWLSKFPGGRELNERVIIKWLGVRGNSMSRRSATFVSVSEFKMASLSTSIFGIRQMRAFLSIKLFVFCNRRSQTPQKWGP